MFIRRTLMTKTAFRILFTVALVVSARAQDTASQIEPGAGSWKTWIISSGKDFRVPPPPDAAATKAELDWVRAAVAEKDPNVVASISYWDAGAPGYRWIELITNRVIAGAPTTAYPQRVYAYIALAM